MAAKLKIFAFLFFLILLIFIFFLFKTRNNRVPVKLEGFIHSAYYYETSESLGSQAIAIVLTVPLTFETPTIQLVRTGVSNDTEFIDGTIIFEPEENHTEYSTAIIKGNLKTLKTMEKLEIVGGIEIPLKMPVSQQYPVVFCIAPSSQDSTLNWPDLIFQIHVSRYYGAHLHFYLTNVSSPIYDFLKIYQSQKYITLQPWLKTSNSTDGAVYTDCLLQYKDATDYIGFMGPNEILIPSGASSYYEEFMREFGGNDEISSLKYEQYLLEVQRGARFSVNVNGRGPGHRVTKRVHNGIYRLENQKIDKMLIQNFGIPKAIRRDIPLLRVDQIAEVEKDWER
ncbi:hypothetical protein CRE_06061 [Caenorhabditis remanei]|uniref:Glycosyltransferase family 92 protein n=1 Tax=Caenorhabditis remanei TaxID=31234 RepID=E3NAY9_CAERE|nr:hypothetical protein CRE_06061 [Caenorhabditis remanei]